MTEPNRKMIAAKTEIARNGKQEERTERSTDRLPPGQKLVTDWPVLDLGIHPEISTEDWKLEISGAADEQVFDWASILQMPQATILTDFHCVTTWSIFDAKVTGVRWIEFLKHLNVRQSASHVMFHGHDQYTTNLPLSELAKPDCMVIHSFNDKPLAKEHGGPMRTWVPHIYAWKSIKWIKKIEFLTDDQRGFWEKKGYHNEADPWLEQRFG